MWLSTSNTDGTSSLMYDDGHESTEWRRFYTTNPPFVDESLAVDLLESVSSAYSKAYCDTMAILFNNLNAVVDGGVVKIDGDVHSMVLLPHKYTNNIVERTSFFAGLDHTAVFGLMESLGTVDSIQFIEDPRPKIRANESQRFRLVHGGVLLEIELVGKVFAGITRCVADASGTWPQSNVQKESLMMLHRQRPEVWKNLAIKIMGYFK